MLPRRIYRHRDAFDTDLKIIKVMYTGLLYTVVKAFIIDRNHGWAYQKAQFTIKQEDMHKWKMVGYDNVYS